MRIFALSDLHVDFEENWAWVQALSPVDYQRDVLIVAGDITHQIERALQTFHVLRKRFLRVLFVPGNHDLWVRGERGDSLKKMDTLRSACEECGIDITPAEVHGVRLVPLFSWYCSQFDPRCQDYKVPVAWGDYRYCKWPEEVKEIDRYFSSLNGEPSTSEGLTVTFSHFLPRWELLPDVTYLRFKALPLVAGSHIIEDQLREWGARIHVFGHSHIPWDEELDGVRYVQQPLAYPKERRGRTPRLKKIY